MGPVSIGGDIRGGSGNNSGTVTAFSGSISSASISGSLLGGSAVNSGSLRAGENIGKITVAGAIAGIDTGSRVFITAGGDPLAGGNAIGSLTIGGRMENTLVLAGYSAANAPAAINGGVSVGKVSIGADLIASSIAAGVTPGVFFPNFGSIFDNAIANPLVSRIASITVKGYAMGTEGGGDFFGFVAEQIDKVQVGGTKQEIPVVGAFTPVGATFTGAARDLNIHVVAPA